MSEMTVCNQASNSALETCSAVGDSLEREVGIAFKSDSTVVMFEGGRGVRAMTVGDSIKFVLRRDDAGREVGDITVDNDK
jgi:aconitase B